MESETTEERGESLKAIDEVKRLGPMIVMPSHMQASDGFGTDHLEKMRNDLRTWGELVGIAKNASDLMEKVAKVFLDRVGDLILGIGAEAALPATST